MLRFAKQNMLRMFFVFLFCEIGKCSNIKHVIWSLVLGVEGCLEIPEPFPKEEFSPKNKKSLTLYLGYYKTVQDTAASLETSKGLALWRGGWCVGQEMIKKYQKGGS